MSAFTNAAVEVSGITPKGVLVKVSGPMQAFGEIFHYANSPHAVSTGGGRAMLEITTQSPTLGARVGQALNPNEMAGYNLGQHLGSGKTI